MTRGNLAPLLSSGRDDWNTPEIVRDCLLRGYHEIDCDPCDNEGSILGARHRIRYESEARVAQLLRGVEFDEGIDIGDGVRDAWHGEGLVFVNPPFGRGTLGFVRRAVEASFLRDVVVLLPARPDTRLWHGWVFPHAAHICWWAGRLTFIGADNPAPFPVALVNFAHTRDASDRFYEAFADHGTITRAK